MTEKAYTYSKNDKDPSSNANNDGCFVKPNMFRVEAECNVIQIVTKQ